MEYSVFKTEHPRPMARLVCDHLLLDVYLGHNKFRFNDEWEAHNARATVLNKSS